MAATNIAPPRKPSTAPPGPARDSQSPSSMTQAEPIIVPKPSAKYWNAPTLPPSRDGLVKPYLLSAA